MNWKTKKAAKEWLSKCGNAPEDIILENLDDFGPHDRVLDFGCGNGRNAVPILRRGAYVTLVDVNPHLLKEAEKNARKSGGRFETLKEDGKLQFRGDYSKIILIGVLHACPDKRAVLEGCYKWLKVGGILYSSSLGESPNRKSPYRFGSYRDFLAAHTDCGFHQLVCKETRSGKSAIYDGIFKKL